MLLEPRSSRRTGNYLLTTRLDNRNASREADGHRVVVLRLRIPDHRRWMARGPARHLRVRGRGGRTRRRELVPAAAVRHDVRRRLLDDRRGLRELPGNPDGRRHGEAVPHRVPVPRGRVPPSVRVQRPLRRGVLRRVLRGLLEPPTRRVIHHPVQPPPTRRSVVRDHGLPDRRLRRHAHRVRLADRRRRGRGSARRRLEVRRDRDRPRARLPLAIGTGIPPEGARARPGRGPLRRHTSPATSFARTLYSCSFIAAGLAEISRYESFSTIFSFTFCRKRIIDAKPFWEIRYSRPSRRTAAFPPSPAKSEIADAMSTSALGSATAMSFAFFPGEFESQKNPASPMW